MVEKKKKATPAVKKKVSASTRKRKPPAKKQKKAGAAVERRIDTERITEIGLQLKTAIEQKDWETLGRVCTVQTVWTVDKPIPVKDWVEMVKRFLEHAEDTELSIAELKKSELTKDSGHFSVRAQLIWSDEDTWEEHELNFDMIMGFIKSRGRWAMDYLGFIPVEKQPPLGGEIKPEIDIRPELELKEPYFKFEPYIRYPYFEPPEIAYPPWWPIPPFPPPGPWPEPWPQPPPYDVPKGYTLVYMPVLMPAGKGV